MLWSDSIEGLHWNAWNNWLEFLKPFQMKRNWKCFQLEVGMQQSFTSWTEGRRKLYKTLPMKEPFHVNTFSRKKCKMVIISSLDCRFQGADIKYCVTQFKFLLVYTLLIFCEYKFINVRFMKMWFKVILRQLKTEEALNNFEYFKSFWNIKQKL